MPAHMLSHMLGHRYPTDLAACPFTLFRTSSDIRPVWKHVIHNLQSAVPYLSGGTESSLSRPGCTAHPDVRARSVFGALSPPVFFLFLFERMPPCASGGELDSTDRPPASDRNRSPHTGMRATLFLVFWARRPKYRCALPCRCL